MAERTPLMRDGRDGGRRTLDPDKITLSDSIRPVGGFRGDSKRTDGSRFSAIAKTCSLKLFFWALLAIVSGVGQSIYLALTLTKVMPSYPYWVFAWTVIPFVLVFLVVLLFFQFATNQITPEMRQLSHKKWFFIGFATMLNGVFLLFAGPHVDGQLQALLGPTVVIVPMSMACSFIYLRRRYSIGQVIGVIIILSGIVVAVLPQLLSSSPSSGSGSGSGGGSGLPSNVTASGSGGGDSSTSGSIFWDIMFVAGSLPSAMMATYEEKAFEDHPIHMAHLMFWSTCYQMITIFLIGGPLSLIKGFGVAGPSEFFAHQAQGFNCFVGIDPPIEDCPDCNCAYAPAFVTLFTVMYILTNYANLGVVKYGNATLSFIVTTVVTPLSFFAYTQVWLVGNPDFTATVPLTGVISLGILMVGVVVYRVFDRSSHPADELVDATVDFRPGAEDDEFITRTVTPISAYMGAGTTQVIRVRKGTMRSRGYKTGINADDPVNERSFFTY